MLYKNRYIVKEIEEKTTWEAEVEEPNIEYDEGLPSPSDIQDVINRVDNGSWDNIDIRESEVLFYPADGDIDYRTGEETRTTVVVTGKPYAIEWFMNLYFHKEKQRKERDNCRRGISRP